MPAQVNIIEIRKPEVDAKLVADNIASSSSVAFLPSRHEAVGSECYAPWRWWYSINAAGRLGGAEIARTEWYREGRVPLHTLRADIDYGTSEAHTTYGVCGLKVWIFKGEIMAHDPLASERRALESAGSGRK